MKKWYQQISSVILPPVILFVIVLVLWHILVEVNEVESYLVPLPADVWNAAKEARFETVDGVVKGNFSQLGQATWNTAVAAVSGFGLSLLIGTLTAFVFSQSVLIRRSFYPYAIFLQTVPIVAIAPLVISWFGTGLQSVIVVTVVISLFPIITSVTVGLTSVDKGLRELFVLNQASRWQTLLKLRMPHAVPYLVTGARTSSGLAVVGAIVGEFFAGYGSDHYGLGYLILHTSAQLRTDMLFATILASALLGVIMFVVVTWIGFKLLARWTYALEQS